MSLLNQLFNRGVFGAKCKTSLNLAISRIKLLQNKRDAQTKHMRKEIAQFLQAGQEAIARIRVEHVIREQNIWAAYEILELFCEFILARVPIIENQRECPTELQEAIASIIFAAPRCSDVPDLLHIKNLFNTKYGKEFVSAVSELRPDSGVNRTIIEKLSVSAPSPEVKLKVLKEIAREYNLEWDSSNAEAELRKRHEDLLGGAKQISGGAGHVHNPTNQGSFESSNSNGPHPTLPNDIKRESQRLQLLKPPSKIPASGTNEIQPSIKHDNAVPDSDVKRETRLQPSDIFERARAALASAERATASARAAAELANVKYGSLKSEEGKSS
ncbi:Vacuolar protein sorting-associated protein [Trema orientale]|uniref:Vacuolar protein sorting-associated protein n=1 Tax=Trema orientale TaxID=63057 RepID=A0A2P5FDS7_TREOI|nr:Vacuolar protein sorting-associated protein [Trema orientale]